MKLKTFARRAAAAGAVLAALTLAALPALAAPKVQVSTTNAVADHADILSDETEQYVNDVSIKLSDACGAQIGVYDVHAYPGQHEVRSGAYAEKLRRIRAEVPAGKKLILGEAGYKYSAPEDSLLKAEYDRRVAGHPFTKGSDCNMLCYDYFYGLDMPLLAMEVMNNGLSGVAAWMLDDAMHSNGDSGRTEDVKIWGMWNILGEEVFGDASQEELRPWYYTWSLMCRHFPAGCDILACEVPQREGLRVAAARKDAAYSVAAVNFSQEPCTLEIVLPGDFAGGVLYRYTESDRACDANGFPAPCERGIAGKRFRTTVPAESFVLLTNVE